MAQEFDADKPYNSVGSHGSGGPPELVEAPGTDEDGLPDLVDAPGGAEGSTKDADEPKDVMNRNEKKARKAIQKLNVRPVTGIHRVSIKKNDGVIFCIDKPDVFSFPGSSAFVCFGNAKSADPRQTTRYQAQQKQAMSQFAAVSAPAETVEDVPVDLTGVRAADVELVMAQSGASKGKAANALRNCDGDIVNAIMELTM